MSKKRDRAFPLRCCKCGKPVGKNLLIPARANGRTLEGIIRVAAYFLCEDCEKSSISTITAPISNTLLRAIKKTEM